MRNTVSALEPLLQPQERLDRLIAAAFRRFGPRLVDLSYANPQGGPSAAVRRVLARVAGECSGRSLQYTPYGGRTATRRAVAEALSREYGLPFQHPDVIMTSGAMPALNIVFRALCEAGDEVVVVTPAWHDYPLYLRNLNLAVRLVPLRADKHFDVPAIAAAIGPRTRGVLFSQPCCPTGVVYSEAEIVQLSDALTAAEARFGTAVYAVSDEVHRRLAWGADSVGSPLNSHPRTVIVYSFGKALAMQGQGIGYIAVSPRMPENEAVRARIERCVRVMGFGNPTSLMQQAICDLLDYEPDLGPLAASQALVRHTLAGYGYDVCDGQASFYVYAKSPLPDDFACAGLLAAQGVLVAPSTLFHESGYIRLSLTAERGRIAAALPAFARILDHVCEVSDEAAWSQTC